MTPLKEIQAPRSLTEEEFMAGFEGETFYPHKDNPPVSAPARDGKQGAAQQVGMTERQ